MAKNNANKNNTSNKSGSQNASKNSAKDTKKMPTFTSVKPDDNERRDGPGGN